MLPSVVCGKVILVAGDSGEGKESGGGSGAARVALEVAEMQAALLGSLREELGPEEGGRFAEAAQRLASQFGAITATAVEAASHGPDPQGDAAGVPGGAPRQHSVEPPRPSRPQPESVLTSAAPGEDDDRHELPSLYRPGHMRRRLEQLVETNRRYGHPFGIAVFDASGPDVRPGDAGETVLATVGAALRESIRIVDEAFLLEEDAICVLAPNLRTVEGVQMAERLLGQLEELERAGGLRIAISAGVVACPDHGADADQLLHKADAAMWRARAVGQPVGVGALEALQDR